MLHLVPDADPAHLGSMGELLDDEKPNASLITLAVFIEKPEPPGARYGISKPATSGDLAWLVPAPAIDVTGSTRSLRGSAFERCRSGREQDRPCTHTAGGRDEAGAGPTVALERHRGRDRGSSKRERICQSPSSDVSVWRQG